MVDIGKLNRRIDVLEYQTDRDEYGGELYEWVVVGRVWASIEPKTGSEFFDNQQIKTSQNVIITMRFYAGITVKHRVRYEDKLYEIVAVIDKGTRHEQTILQCKEVIDGQELLSQTEAG